jgi:hypothetical protein
MEHPSNRICSIEYQKCRLKAIGKTGLLLPGNMNFVREKCGGGGNLLGPDYRFLYIISNIGGLRFLEGTSHYL